MMHGRFVPTICRGILGGILATTAAQAESDLTMTTVLQGTGTACLAGGAAVGATVAAGGPAVAVPVGTLAAVAPAPTAAAAIASGLVGCGLGASAAVVYYGATWTYQTFLTGPKYPLLYPPPNTAVGTQTQGTAPD